MSAWRILRMKTDEATYFKAFQSSGNLRILDHETYRDLDVVMKRCMELNKGTGVGSLPIFDGRFALEEKALEEQRKSTVIDYGIVEVGS